MSQNIKVVYDITIEGNIPVTVTQTDPPGWMLDRVANFMKRDNTLDLFIISHGRIEVDQQGVDTYKAVSYQFTRKQLNYIGLYIVKTIKP